MHQEKLDEYDIDETVVSTKLAIASRNIWWRKFWQITKNFSISSMFSLVKSLCHTVLIYMIMATQFIFII